MHEIIRIRFLLKFLKFIIKFYLIVVVTGSCRMGNANQSVFEWLNKQEAASCLIASE